MPDEELEPLEPPMPPDEWKKFLVDEWPLCGCGRPDEVLALLRDVLRVLRVRRTLGFEEVRRQLDALLPSTAVQMQYFYLLSHFDLEEHGGGVPGWLTAKGERVLASLETYGCTAKPPHGHSLIERT